MKKSKMQVACERAIKKSDNIDNFYVESIAAEYFEKGAKAFLRYANKQRHSSGLPKLVVDLADLEKWVKGEK